MPDVVTALGVPNLTPRRPARPGERAPDFALHALRDDRIVSLADYRGRAALLLVIERGLFCPFCRKHIAQLGVVSPKLGRLGVEVLAVFATPAERARAYLAARPAPIPLAADPKHEVHQAYGLPRFASTPETEARVDGALIDPFGDLPSPRPARQIADALSRDDPYEWTPADQAAYDIGQIQTTGQFLVDREGIVRWRNVEGAVTGLAGLGQFPSEKDLVAAAQEL
ncbi:MAG: redoxin domain-containing protein [Candidatus Rokubacteria bacterium]|nr:redoxin domain-containing protein [Candidatus Rokubacteria bacterium]